MILVRTPSTITRSQSQDPVWYRAFQLIASAYCYIGGILPLAWLGASYGLYIRYKLTFDVWPTSRQELWTSFPLQMKPIMGAVFVLPFFFLPWAVPMAGFALTSPRYLPFPHFVWLLAIWPATLIFVILDPGGFLIWSFRSSD
jgi:hypothetical protein